MDWVNGHDIEVLAKQVTRKGEHLTASPLFAMELTCFTEITKAISLAPEQEQPTQEDIQDYIHKVSNIYCNWTARC